MVGGYHRFNGHEFEQTPGDSEWQGSLVCCSPLGHRVGHDFVTEQLQQLYNLGQLILFSVHLPHKMVKSFQWNILELLIRSYMWKNYGEFKEHGIGNIILIYDADLNVSSSNDMPLF